jgi:L-amino acid N-acyltransferase YncA
VRKWLGTLKIEIEGVEERTLGEVLSHEIVLNEETTPVFERQLREGELSLLVMRDRKGRKIGMSILCPAIDSLKKDCALVFSIWLPFWIRGVGLGSEMLSAAIREARRRGYSRIGGAVRPKNVKSLGMFRKAGFREVSEHELFTRGPPWDKTELEGRLWLELTL